jgi:hypothetical protein
VADSTVTRRRQALYLAACWAWATGLLAIMGGSLGADLAVVLTGFGLLVVALALIGTAVILYE